MAYWSTSWGLTVKVGGLASTQHTTRHAKRAIIRLKHYDPTILQ